MNNFRTMAAVLAITMVMGSFAAPAQAKSFLEDWFPFLFEEPDTGPKPEETGQAPFIEKKVIDTAASKQMGVEHKPFAALESGFALDQAHRQPAQIADWATQVISVCLDLDPAAYETHEKIVMEALTPYALDSFKAFLAKDNLLAALKSNDLIMRSFVTEPSRLLNQGAVQGRYRWLVETPVTISFLPRGTDDYKGIQPKSQRINVRMQIGRVQENRLEGLIIETLEFLPVAAPK